MIYHPYDPDLPLVKEWRNGQDWPIYRTLTIDEKVWLIEIALRFDDMWAFNANFVSGFDILIWDGDKIKRWAFSEDGDFVGRHNIEDMDTFIRYFPDGWVLAKNPRIPDAVYYAQQVLADVKRKYDAKRYITGDERRLYAAIVGLLDHIGITDVANL